LSLNQTRAPSIFVAKNWRGQKLGEEIGALPRGQNALNGKRGPSIACSRKSAPGGLRGLGKAARLQRVGHSRPLKTKGGLSRAQGALGLAGRQLDSKTTKD